MTKRLRPYVSYFALCLTMGSAAAVAATNTRTWISGHGVDQAGCGPVASPCRTLQYAHDSTIAGGEIDVLDPAGYGSVAISKSISIVNDGVGIAGVLATSGGDAIHITAQATDQIILRGLTIEGAGVGANGVVVGTAPASLSVNNCTIQNFSGTDATHGNGILIAHGSGAPRITITNTDASNNGNAGILYRAQATGAATIAIENVIATNNHYGIAIDNRNAQQNSNVSTTITDSVASNNTTIGVQVFSSGNLDAFTTLKSLTATGNGQGVFLGGSYNYVTFADCVVLFNLGPDVIGDAGSTNTVFSTYKNNMIGTFAGSYFIDTNSLN